VATAIIEEANAVKNQRSVAVLLGLTQTLAADMSHPGSLRIIWSYLRRTANFPDSKNATPQSFGFAPILDYPPLVPRSMPAI
jgi:hypothetical protein